MALMTARPWKAPKTGVYHLLQRTPRDLLPRLKGTTVSLPIADEFATVRVGDIIQASLRTKDAREAKQRHAVADAALKRWLDAERNGPSRLTHKQALALAGVLFRDFTEAHEDDPGEAERWLIEHRDDILAQYGKAGRARLMIGEDARRQFSREERFGKLADELLAREGLVIDADSRTRLVDAVAEALGNATLGILRMAGGDYSPDPTGARFPAWSRPSEPKAAPPETITAAALFDRWAAYSADKKAPNTIKRYRGSFRSLIAFVKDRDIRSLTQDDLYAWANHRKEVEGVHASAINRNDLVAARAFSV